MKLSQTLFIFLCLLVFTQTSCKEDECDDPTNPECPNYDYCQTVEDLSADFETYLYDAASPFGDGKLYRLSMVVRDTTFGGSLNFRALDSMAETYEWNFGDDPRTNYGRETDLRFDPNDVNGNLEIDLTVYREEERCPDRGSEVSANTETIYIIEPDADFDKRPILGTFVGNNESEPDSADFEIQLFLDEQINEIRLKGFPRGAENGERLNNPILNSNYKEFILMPTANFCCSRAHGIGTLSDDKQSVNIKYKVFDFDTEEWIDLVWTGTRKSS